MKAAVELEVFTAIAEGNITAAAIAKRCEASERGVRVLCDFLTIHGFLTKDGTQYGLTQDSAVFLNRKSPAYCGGVIEFLLTPRVREAHALLTEAVRRGGSALGEGNMVPENPDWVKFARAMMPIMVMPAQIMAAELCKGGEAHKVLDIAAGQGSYGMTVGSVNLTEKIEAGKWKNVLAVAEENARAMGAGHRHHPLPGVLLMSILAAATIWRWWPISCTTSIPMYDFHEEGACFFGAGRARGDCGICSQS
jgi:hypothetical protein